MVMQSSQSGISKVILLTLSNGKISTCFAMARCSQVFMVENWSLLLSSYGTWLSVASGWRYHLKLLLWHRSWVLVKHAQFQVFVEHYLDQNQRQQHQELYSLTSCALFILWDHMNMFYFCKFIIIVFNWPRILNRAAETRSL